jgi:CheY-like chemotaxis protein
MAEVVRVSAGTSERCVLVVEDDAPIRTMLADLLGDAGYGVIQAGNGREGLSRLHEQQPDLIVLDLMMPSMTGWEFLDRAREELQRLNVPVMILSAIQGKSDYPNTLGVDAWFTKPLDIPRFLRAAERLAGTPQTVQQNDGPESVGSARVLVIEDEPLIRDLLTEQLGTEGYIAEGVGSLARARASIKVMRPDVILLDLMLPIEDGWTFLRARQADAQMARIPVIAISAAPHVRLREAKQLGANAFLSKPFDQDALTVLIRSFVG